MASLKLFYSSGSALTNIFGKDPSESIGGFVTAIEFSDLINNLFRDVSQKGISNGSKEYRIIFIKNDHATDVMTTLRFWHKIPIVTATLDPSSLSPSDGDEYIVPVGGTGDWDGQVGKRATYVLVTTSWTFSLAPMATYRFGFISPINNTLDEVTLVGEYVDTLDSVFTPPYGVTLVSADDTDGTSQVTIGAGGLAAQSYLAMVIERDVAVARLRNDDFACPDAGYVEEQQDWDNTILELQNEYIEFNYDI